MLHTLRRIPVVVWRVLLHSMLIGLGMSFFDVLFNFYLVSIGYKADTIGVLSTVARIGGLVVGIPAGRLIDRIGARRALILSVLVYMVGLVSVLYAPDRIWLFAAQFVVGCAFAMLFSALFPLLTVTTPHAQQPTVFGLNEMALNTIGLVGSMLAGWLPSIVGPWLNVSSQSTLAYRVVLLIGVVVLTASALPLLGTLEPAPHLDDDGVPIVTAAPMRSNWQIVSYGIAGFLIGMGSGTFFPFQSLFLRDHLHLTDSAVGTVLAFGGVTLGVGALAAGHVFGERNLRVWSSVFRIAAAPALLLMLAPTVWAAVVGFLLRALLIGCSISLNDVLTMRLVNPQQRGFSSSVGNMAWAAGWAITATLSGYVQTAYGFTPLLVLGALAYVLSGLAIWWFERE
jgi:MFS family permease